MNRALTIGYLLLSMAPAAAFAQAAAPAPSPASSEPRAEEGGLAEVIVTANKREQNIEKVGLSVQAIAGAQLEERRITSLEDVASAVPGLSYAPSANNTPIF